MTANDINKATASVEDSIAKIREAQAKFEKAQKTFEQVQEKAAIVAEKLKAAKQKAKDAKAAFKPKMGKVPGMAGMVAVLVGILKAQLILKVQEEVLKMIDKFLQTCPNPKDLERIIKTKDNLLKNINSFQKRIEAFANIAQTLLTIATALKILIKVITSIPIPTAVPPGVGIPVNVLTKFSNTLIKINKILDKLIADAAAISALTGAVLGIVSMLKAKLEEIDAKIQRCVINPLADPNTDTIDPTTSSTIDPTTGLLVTAALVNTAQPKENTGSEGTPTDSAGNIDPNYLFKSAKTGTTYTLSILQDPNSPKIAPKRYAIAKDPSGVIKLIGDSSFSSSTQVLLDELKFKIDNQLL